MLRRKKDPYGRVIGNYGFNAARVVVVVDGDMNFRVCFRSEKADDETEIAVIRKDIFFSGGLTVSYWDKVIPRYAKKLEEGGLYIKRDVITNKTPCIPGLEGFAEKKKE